MNETKYVGIDLHSASSSVRVVDAQGAQCRCAVCWQQRQRVCKRSVVVYQGQLPRLVGEYQNECCPARTKPGPDASREDQKLLSAERSHE